MSSPPTTTRLALWSIRGLALTAMAVAGYLAVVAWQAGTVAGCTGGALDCNTLLSGKWARWLGLPVSLLGMTTYTLLFIVSWFLPVRIESRHPLAAKAILACLALLAAGAAIWFFVLQALVLHAFCLYCCLVHATGLVICMLVFFVLLPGDRDPQTDMMILFQAGPHELPAQPEQTNLQPRQFAAISLVAVIGWASLILGQVFGPYEEFVFETSSSNSKVAELIGSKRPTGDQRTGETAAGQSRPDENGLQADSESRLSQSDPGFDASNDPQDENSIPSTTDAGQPSPLDEPPENSPFRFDAAAANGAGADEPLGSTADNDLGLDVSQYPVLGNPRAKHVIVELFDYTCMHCRRLHPMLAEALQRYDNQITIVVQPVALCKECNPFVTKTHRAHKNACEYAKLSLAVWKIDHTLFPEFHNWLLASEEIPNLFDAKSHAIQLAGTEVITRAITSGEVREALDKNNQTQKRIDKGLPSLLMKPGNISGLPSSKELLYKALEKHLGLQPPGPLATADK
jgi:uncharacterized membrane protein/protein-disulfide isomerase